MLITLEYPVEIGLREIREPLRKPDRNQIPGVVLIGWFL